MKPVLQSLKKDPLLALFIFFAILGVLWFWLAPGGFKAIWSKNPLVADIIREHALVEEKSKIVTISYYYPNFQYFSDIVSGSQQPKKEWMEGYFFGKPYIFHSYYQKTVDLLPQIDAGHYLLGFSEYYMGNPDIALTQYEKAANLNPYFFWSYYNLGVIYFAQGNYLKSAESLHKALSLRKEFTLEILQQSPFYRQIWRNIANPPQILESNLDQGEMDAAFLLSACFFRVGGYDQSLQIIQTIGKTGLWHQQLWQKLYQKAISRQKSMEDMDPLIQEQIPVRLF